MSAAGVAGRLAPLALLGLLACGTRDAVDAESGGAALMRNLLRAGRAELVLAEAPARELAARRARAFTRERDGWELGLGAGGPDAARVVVGSHADAAVRALVERLGARTGVREGQPWFAIDEVEFPLASDGLAACFEDPERPGLPLTLLYVNDAACLERLVAHGLGAGWKPSFRAWRDGRELLCGPLDLAGRIVAPRLARPTATRAEVEYVSQPLAPGRPGFSGRVQEGCDPERLEQVLAEAARARGRAAEWAAPGAALPALELQLYARAEDFVRAAGAASAAAIDPMTRRVRVCLASGLPGDGGAEAARAALRSLLGECAEPWLEDGAALDAAGVWWGAGLDEAQARLHAAGLEPALPELLDARARESISPHLLLPARAALFRLLLETRGAAFVRELWEGRAELAADAELATRLDAALAARPANLARPARAFPAPAADARLAWRGVESEPSLGGPGWESQAAQAGFAQLRELGVNALALRVTLVARPDPLALPDPLHARVFGTREGDLTLVSALVAARGLRLATLVEVDLLASPGGVEDAAWPRTRPEQWQRFFASRRAALLHVALLAEAAGVDALSLGCGLDAVTSDVVSGRRARAQDLEERRRGWAEVLRVTRRAFGGALVYVAGSHQELDQLLFAGELDALGFRLDEQLEVASGGGPAALRLALAERIGAALEHVSGVAARHGKPWFLARTSFEPLPPGLAGARAGDAATQAGQFEMLGAALQALARERRPAALFLARWPSDPSDRGLDPRDGVLTRREVLEALGRLYRVL